jgi:hypothetical protein
MQQSTFKPLPPWQLLDQLFRHDDITGILYWRAKIPNGYEQPCVGQQVMIDGERHITARVVWKLVHGVDPSGVVDHRDRDDTNNRIANLRDVTPGENAVNSGLRSTNRSGFKGVSRAGNKWHAAIRANGKLQHLGNFVTRVEAAAAYQRASKEFHPAAWSGSAVMMAAVLPST